MTLGGALFLAWLAVNFIGGVWLLFICRGRR